ncbi:hypothetical protein EGW08_001401 [Elysia chlorotica]|uniref:Uncharacterized protein n=1 Tax=Elysia chlorotica TaxID=188477 RepID=A0A433UAN5_ELYCH|nr:hypothetical protein EGW08_001401 [Elysia chlorotica]
MKMDWSNCGEYLAVGGFVRLPNLQCRNEVHFYSKDGSLIHWVNIPSQVRRAGTKIREERYGELELKYAKKGINSGVALSTRITSHLWRGSTYTCHVSPLVWLYLHVSSFTSGVALPTRVTSHLWRGSIYTCTSGVALPTRVTSHLWRGSIYTCHVSPLAWLYLHVSRLTSGVALSTRVTSHLWRGSTYTCHVSPLAWLYLHVSRLTSGVALSTRVTSHLWRGSTYTSHLWRGSIYTCHVSPLAWLYLHVSRLTSGVAVVVWAPVLAGLSLLHVEPVAGPGEAGDLEALVHGHLRDDGPRRAHHD